MLSSEEKEGLERMSPEDLVKLFRLIQEAKAMFSVKGCVPQSAMDDLIKAVPDKVCHEIVQDLRTAGRSEPGFLPPSKGPAPVRGSGWTKPMEHNSPSGLRYVDQLCDLQDALDRRDLEKRLKGG